MLKNKVIAFLQKCHWIPDEVYLKIIYYLKMGEKLNLDNPQKFSEKLQWLKLYDRNPKYTQYVDKYEVKEYIKQVLGEEYVIPTIGVYDCPEEIDFEKLPSKFVLKCTHDSGGLVLCQDKMKLEKQEVIERLNKCLKRKYFYKYREWPYKDVKPRIICEKLLEENIKDYKFYCFHGEPCFLYVSQGLVIDHTLKVDFYSMEWEKEPFKRLDYENFDETLEKPTKFKEMKEICRKLSKNLNFVRVDLYQVGEKIFFSELTFTPCAGFMPIEPIAYDKILGEKLKLPMKEK